MARFPYLPLLVMAALTSCQTVSFYGQAAAGQWEILRKSRPNATVIADPATSPPLRRKLQSVEEIRRFAIDRLDLPGGEAYGKYADLGRPHVVWVLYAAPEFSLQPKTWYYPAVGNLDYRGYFHESDAETLAGRLRGEGYDVYVGGVDAYSTLGWFHDPVLNTFVGYPDIDLAETLFHELTHRKIFHRADTVFNETLANAVAEEGVQRWLAFHHRTADLEKYRTRLVRRSEFYEQVDIARERLRRLYASGRPPAEMRNEKAAILVRLQGQFRELRRRWGGHGLEAWLNQDINNGHIVSLDLYYRNMDVFRDLLARFGGDLDEFYQKADRVKLPPERDSQPAAPAVSSAISVSKPLFRR